MKRMLEIEVAFSKLLPKDIFLSVALNGFLWFYAA
jgi:hypothetical protein